ncbi:MAG: hypothetical protein QOH01_1379 [Verrucomicrobiota bacterium]|jgi:hypothetical protein
MIAISYRREDSSPVTGRLFDRLQTEFGRRNVFMDFDSIPFGVDFRDKIKVTLEKARVVVAVVGPNWVGQREGKRRIDDPRDFVRIEIAAALERGIPVIPVLLDHTVMPDPEQLPEELRPFAFRNALTLDTGVDFHHHASRLISGIRELTNGGPARKTTTGGRWPVVAGIILVVGLIAGGAWWAMNAQRPTPTASMASPTQTAAQTAALSPAATVAVVSPVPGTPLVLPTAGPAAATAVPSVNTPANFQRVTPRIANTPRTIMNERFRSADGSAEFAIFAIRVGDLPATADARRIAIPRAEGETITERTPLRDSAHFHEDVTVAGPRGGYTRYFAVDAPLTANADETARLWEFWVRDERALQSYKEAYRAFKKSVAF